MKFTIAADTDKGNVKKTNQDSMLIKHAQSEIGEVVMAIVCDGMGGLSDGELASAAVIRKFSDWFDFEFSDELEHPDMRVIGDKWALMLRELNGRLAEYGKTHKNLGTTFTGILMLENEYVLVHVGDTRAYHINNEVKQLTEDQTFVAREVKEGRMTEEEAKTDKMRNVLLQCVGASKEVVPEVICGTTAKGTYMLCSDGFRHEISNEEIRKAFTFKKNDNRDSMKKKIRNLIDLVKSRNEKDNISALVIKVD